MANIPIFFVIYQADLDVNIYKLNVIDEEKCNTIIDVYTKIAARNNKNEILGFSSSMINLFNGVAEDWHLRILEKYIKFDIIEKIAELESLNDKYQMNTTQPSKTYFVDFSDR